MKKFVELPVISMECAKLGTLWNCYGTGEANNSTKTDVVSGLEEISWPIKLPSVTKEQNVGSQKPQFGNPTEHILSEFLGGNINVLEVEGRLRANILFNLWDIHIRIYVSVLLRIDIQKKILERVILNWVIIEFHQQQLSELN